MDIFKSLNISFGTVMKNPEILKSQWQIWDILQGVSFLGV